MGKSAVSKSVPGCSNRTIWKLRKIEQNPRRSPLLSDNLSECKSSNGVAGDTIREAKQAID